MSSRILSLYDLALSHVARYESDLQLNLPLKDLSEEFLEAEAAMQAEQRFKPKPLSMQVAGAEIVLKAWQKLKQEVPKGPLNIPAMMFEVEASLRLGREEDYVEQTKRMFSPLLDALQLPQSLRVCSLFIQLFRNTETILKKSGMDLDFRRIPVVASEFVIFQIALEQVEEGRALASIWTKLCKAVPDLPEQVDFADEMRQILQEPKYRASIETVIELSLSGLELRAIPPEIRMFRGLQMLDLSNNSLTQIPPKVLCLLPLNKLSLAKNQLEDISGIGEISQLEYLDLSENCIRELPAGFTNLRALKFLFLKINDLQELPEDIGNLVNLEHCNFNHNQLTVLPDSFAHLPKITKLYLSFNYFKIFPRPIVSLTSLQYLDMKHNQLTSLPNELTQNLKNLKKINLSWNNLEFLPDSLGLASNLFLLNLDYNPIAKLPNSIGDLRSLSILQLSHLLYLRELPKTFGNLATLRQLDLAATTLAFLPNNFGDLTSLESLSLSRMTLRNLPESFQQLQALDSLELDETAFLSMTPNLFEGLNALTVINISNRSLKEIPVSLQALGQVRHLYCSGNDLRDLPPWLLELNHLQTLTLFNGAPETNRIAWLFLREKEAYDRELYKARREEFFRNAETHLGKSMQFFTLHQDEKAREEWEKIEDLFPLDTNPLFIDWPSWFEELDSLRKERIHGEVSRLSGKISDQTETFLWNHPLAFYDAIELTSSRKRKVSLLNKEGSPQKKEKQELP